MSGNILCEFYCLGLHKRLNSSRHHVNWLASKSDSVSQGKVQSQKLPILCRSDPLCFLSWVSVVSHVFRSISFMWGIVGLKYEFWPFWGSNKSGTHLEFKWGPCGFGFSSMRRWSLDIYMSKTNVGWMRNWCSKMVPYKGCCVDKEHTILLVPHRKLRRSFKSIYNALLTFGLGPQGVPSFVEGRGPRLRPIGFLHTRALPPPSDRPCCAELSRVVGAGAGAGASTKGKYFFLDPVTFSYYENLLEFLHK